MIKRKICDKIHAQTIKKIQSADFQIIITQQKVNHYRKNSQNRIFFLFKTLRQRDFYSANTFVLKITQPLIGILSVFDVYRNNEKNKLYLQTLYA
jgi:hypothetical protein